MNLESHKIKRFNGTLKFLFATALIGLPARAQIFRRSAAMHAVPVNERRHVSSRVVDHGQTSIYSGTSMCPSEQHFE